MIRGLGNKSLTFVAHLSLVLALVGCATGKQSQLLDDVAKADLSAKGPRDTGRGVQAVSFGQQSTDIKYYADQTSVSPLPGVPAPASASSPEPAVDLSAVDGSAAGYQLNLQGAPLVDAAKSLFEDVLKVPYTIDPRAQGTITMSTGGPVSQQDLLRIFVAALQLNDLQLIHDGKQYKIVTSAVTAEGNPGGENDAAQLGAGYGITGIPLRFVGADKMLALLDGFAIKAGSARAAPSGNLLLVRGTAQERESVSGIAMALDSNAFAQDRAGIAFLKNADSSAVLDDLTAMGKDDGVLSQVRFQNLDRVNGILVVAHDRRNLDGALNWVRRLDQESLEGDGVHVYQVQFARASKLADVLTRTFGDSRSGGAGDVSGSDRPAASENSGKDSSGNDGSGDSGPSLDSGTPGDPSQTGDISAPMDGTFASRLGAVNIGYGGNTPGSTQGGAISGGGSGKVRITANDDDNTLVIRAPGYAYRRVLGLLRTIDRPPVQVLINVMIAEVTLNDTLRYGVQAYLRGDGSALVQSAARPPLAMQLPGANVVIGGIGDPKVVLDALSQVTKVKVVSSPSVIALENQQAVIKVGDQVPVTTQQVISTQTSTPPVINSIEYRDAGVVLKVTPRVSQTNLVTMSVAQELSAVTGNSTGVNLTPTLRQRAISSSVAVYDRQTLVLGGLIAGTENNEKQSLPLLNRIPILGDVVGRTSKTGARTELVVFITPKVVRDQYDASAVSTELRSKLQGLLN